MKRRFLSLVLLAAAALAPAGLSAQDRILDVPYVPTKFPVVDEMLKMAGVAKTDLLTTWGAETGGSSSEPPRNTAPAASASTSIRPASGNARPTPPAPG